MKVNDWILEIKEIKMKTHLQPCNSHRTLRLYCYRMFREIHHYVTSVILFNFEDMG